MISDLWQKLQSYFLKTSFFHIYLSGPRSPNELQRASRAHGQRNACQFVTHVSLVQRVPGSYACWDIYNHIISIEFGEYTRGLNPAIITTEKMVPPTCSAGSRFCWLGITFNEIDPLKYIQYFDIFLVFQSIKIFPQSSHFLNLNKL